MPHQRATPNLSCSPSSPPKRRFTVSLRLCTYLLAALVVSLGIMTGLTLPSSDAHGSQPTTSGECGLAPVRVPLFGGTPAAVVALTPAASPEPDPAAVVVDQATIQEAATEIVACINTGDPSFEYAVFTPRYLATRFVDEAGHYQPEFEFLLDSPAPPVTPAFALEAVEEIEEQPDGRVKVTLVLRSDEATFRDTFLLTYVERQWLIDDVVALDPMP